MDENNNKNNYLKYPYWITSISTLVIAITAIFGLIFIFKELNETQNQTEILNQTLIQSYRPVGVIRTSFEEKSLIAISKYESERKDKFTFSYDPFLMNMGQGILSFIGHIYFLSNEKIDFRTYFLNGKIKEFKIDGVYDYARMKPILPKDTQQLLAPFSNIEFDYRYFLYFLVFYKDQDGNLYDTEHLAVISFEEQSVVNLQPKIDGERSYYRDIYHFFSDSEKEKLITIFKGIGHPMWKFF